MENIVMTNLEKETVLIFNEAEKTAQVDTFNSKMKNQLATYAKENPEDCRLLREHKFGNQCYEIPKSWIKIQRPRQLTEEERNKRAEIMKRVRESRGL